MPNKKETTWCVFKTTDYLKEFLSRWLDKRQRGRVIVSPSLVSSVRVS